MQLLKQIPLDDRFLIRAIAIIFFRIHKFKENVRAYFYSVVLTDHKCPRCSDDLEMLRDSWCRCISCGEEFDPTIRFQRCPDCGGRVSKKIYHYFCLNCGRQLRSNYCFDERVFNKEYFTKKMQESRKKKRERKERIKKMLLESRSKEYALDCPISLTTIPGLEETLDRMVGCPFPKELLLKFINNPEFDMTVYRKHIMANLTPTETLFEVIPPLNTSDARKDRIWRFITLIFMAHEREVNLCQSNNILVVERNEAYGEG